MVHHLQRPITPNLSVYVNLQLAHIALAFVTTEEQCVQSPMQTAHIELLTESLPNHICVALCLVSRPLLGQIQPGVPASTRYVHKQLLHVRMRYPNHDIP
jgi:hypothetical protein